MAIGKKYGGRIKGTPNLKTAEAMNRAERIVAVIESNHLEKDIKNITPRERMNLYATLLEYIMPKLSRQELKGNLSHKIELRVVRSTNTNNT